MEFGEELVANPRFAGRVGQQRRIKQRDEGFGNRLGLSVRGPAEHRAQDGSGLDWRLTADSRVSDRGVDPLELQPVGDRRRRGALASDDPAKVKRQSVGGLRRTDVAGDRFPLAAQFSQLGFDGLGDQDFVQSAGRLFIAQLSCGPRVAYP